MDKKATSIAEAEGGGAQSPPGSCAAKDRIHVLVLDLWCYVPYYDRYFCEGLADVNVVPRLAAASYYLDPGYFKKHDIRNRPGLLDVASRTQMPDQIRRILMLFESCINLLALSVSILFAKPDIVHVQWIPLVRKLPFDIWFLAFTKRLGIKVVYTVHNVLPHDTGRRFERVYARVYSKADALICHTQQARNQLETEFAINPNRIWVIPHGPLFHDAEVVAQDFRKQAGIPRNACVVLMQGMLKPYKGVDFLLDAWQQVPSRTTHARLLIVGSAEREFEAEIRNRADSLGIKDSISLDFRYISDEELSHYYAAADILVYPYKAVTASGALMTGLSFRKPVIVTRLPAFLETFEEEKSALFVAFGDTQGLAASIERLIQSPTERTRLAEEGAQVLRRKYSWRSIADQTRDCYTQILGGHRC